VNLLPVVEVGLDNARDNYISSGSPCTRVRRCRAKGVKAAKLACGTYKTYALHLRR